jgi:integrase
MVLVAACLGLRASEIVGLQWQDLSWEDLTVFILRRHWLLQFQAMVWKVYDEK